MKRILLLAAAGFIALSVQAQIPDPIPNTYINDLTQKLSPEQIRTLNDSILSIEKRTSVQIAVIIIPSLPPDIEIEDYAREVGNKWGVGNAQNGVVYVASLQEHKQRLEIARNLEGDLPDVVCLHITDDLKPFLRAENYAGAIGELVKQINDRVDPVAKEQLRLAEIESNKKRDRELRSVMVGLGWISFVRSIRMDYILYFLSPGDPTPA